MNSLRNEGAPADVDLRTPVIVCHESQIGLLGNVVRLKMMPTLSLYVFNHVIQTNEYPRHHQTTTRVQHVFIWLSWRSMYWMDKSAQCTILGFFYLIKISIPRLWDSAPPVAWAVSRPEGVVPSNGQWFTHWRWLCLGKRTHSAGICCSGFLLVSLQARQACWKEMASIWILDTVILSITLASGTPLFFGVCVQERQLI